MSDLPEPLVPPDCDVSDLPVPHAMLAEMAADAFGLSETEVAKLLTDMGCTRVGNGWVMGSAGNG